MDWALIKPDITPDGVAHYVQNDTPANLGDRQ